MCVRRGNDKLAFSSPFQEPVSVTVLFCFVLFQLCAEILRPRSRGFVKLRSRDPLTHPIIQPNYLARDSDRRLMRSCVQIARHVLNQKAFEPYRKKELKPGLWKIVNIWLFGCADLGQWISFLVPRNRNKLDSLQDGHHRTGTNCPWSQRGFRPIESLVQWNYWKKVCRGQRKLYFAVEVPKTSDFQQRVESN